MKNQHHIPLVSSTGWTVTRPILLYSVRVLQFLFTVATLGLLSYVISNLIHEDTANYGLAVSVISLVYLIVIGALTFYSPEVFIPGALLIAEFVLMVLWLCAFIALAAIWGPVLCSEAVGTLSYSFYFFSYDLRKPCGCAQAAIAMAGVCWALFAFSCFLLLRNIVLPLSRAYTDSPFWQPLNNRSFAVHKVTGLALLQIPAHPSDFEAAGLEESATAGNDNLEPVFTDKVFSEESLADPAPLLAETNVDGAISIDIDPHTDQVIENRADPVVSSNLVQEYETQIPPPSIK